MESKILPLEMVSFSSLNSEIQPYMREAQERIFSIAAGTRMGVIAPYVMSVGFSKILYAGAQLGSEFGSSFIFFAPDGTCSLNIERTRRGFSYGGLLSLESDGFIATNNSMPNGCGFSMYELNEEMEDAAILKRLQDSQCRLGEEELKQLGTGNHFAAMYRLLDPESGEDSHRRMLVVHCSGHAGGDLLYYPSNWLSDTDGYYRVSTPHGFVELLEGEARRLYVEQFRNTELINAANRDKTASQIFVDMDWELKESITHQGLLGDGGTHIIGTQRHDGLMPVAFNPEEGLMAVRTKPNIRAEIARSWEESSRAQSLGVDLGALNLTPHGGGYELRNPLISLTIKLDKMGIESFSMEHLSNSGTHVRNKFPHFREVRDLLTYRRAYPIIKQMVSFDLAEVVYTMQPLMQVYPKVSIPGGHL